MKKEFKHEIKIYYEDYTGVFCVHKKPVNLFYKFDPMHLSEEGHDLVFLNLSKKI